MDTRLLIAVDVMSGDHGPQVCVPGALAALREDPRPYIALVGDPGAIEPLLAAVEPALRARITVHAASQVVTMAESPREAIRRKKDSSLRRAIDLVADGTALACVSAGNTGALMATAHFVLGMIEGIERPAIMCALPTVSGHTQVLDLGANADATPPQLVQFAAMGNVIAREIDGLERPRIGLLNIGAEDTKGNARVQEAQRLLAQTRLNYIGYVEGDGICTDAADVVVTDGFTGNVALKSMEGMVRMIAGALKEEFSLGPLRRMGAVAAWPALSALRTRLDPRRYNGASMVGLTGVVVKSHGGADEFAFANAVQVGITEAAKGIPARISAQLMAQAA